MTEPIVAVLGTGIMGAGMARSLRRAGLEVRAWNRTIERARPLEEAGVRVEPEAADAVRGADVVLTMLSDAAAVHAAMQMAEPGLSAGQIWLQTSTVGIGPIESLVEFADKHGLRFVDSPVSGTRQPAESGQLLVLAAGAPDVREPLAPVLEAISARTIWLDEDSARATATRLKLVVNGWALATTSAAAEAIALSEALGLDPTLFTRTIAGGALDSTYLQTKAKAITDRDFTANFTAVLAAKDAGLIVQAGREAGLDLAVAAAIAEQFARTVEAGYGENDMSAIYLVTRGNADTNTDGDTNAN